MATTDINIPTNVHKGKGGLWGKILGGILGAAAAAGATIATAGAAAPVAAPAAAGAAGGTGAAAGAGAAAAGTAAALPAGTAALPVVATEAAKTGGLAGVLSTTKSVLGSSMLGQNLGGTVGEFVDPTKVDQGGPGIAGMAKTNLSESAPKPIELGNRKKSEIGNLQRFALRDPDVQTSILDDSINNITNNPRIDRDQKKEAIDYFTLAKNRIRNPLG